MVAYEFYWHDNEGESHFIGILPERRKDPERITRESVLNWGRMAIGGEGDPNRIYVVQIEVNSRSGSIFVPPEPLKS